MDNELTRVVREAHRPSAVTVAAMLALAAVSVVGLVLDPRLLAGQPLWAKPFKFAASFVLYFGTVALLVPLATGRAARVARVAANVLVGAAVVEIVAIVGQAARGRASHFNFSTPLDAAVYEVMAAGAATLWAGTAVLAAVLLRQRSLAPALHRGVALGAVVSLLGMAVAFLMTSPTAAQLAAPVPAVLGHHAVGGPDGGAGLPLLGWSTTGGDLRVGHFVGLHALQALPLLALALGILARRVPVLAPERVRARLVTVAAAGYAGLTALLTWQALRAQPLLAPDAGTLGAAVALVVAVALAVVLVVRPTTVPLAAPAS